MLENQGYVPEEVLKEANCLHPNDVAAGLTPESTIEERQDIILKGEIFLPAAQGNADLKITPENIHPLVFEAVQQINEIEGIRTTGSGPDVIYGFIEDDLKAKIIAAMKKAVEETVFNERVENGIRCSSKASVSFNQLGTSFDLFLPIDTKLKNAKTAWLTLVGSIKRNLE